MPSGPNHGSLFAQFLYANQYRAVRNHAKMHHSTSMIMLFTMLFILTLAIIQLIMFIIIIMFCIKMFIVMFRIRRKGQPCPKFVCATLSPAEGLTYTLGGKTLKMEQGSHAKGVHCRPLLLDVGATWSCSNSSLHGLGPSVSDRPKFTNASVNISCVACPTA